MTKVEYTRGTALIGIDSDRALQLQLGPDRPRKIGNTVYGWWPRPTMRPARGRIRTRQLVSLPIASLSNGAFDGRR